MTNRYNKRLTTAATLRTHAEISAFFAGTDLLLPGVVQYHQWNPGEPPAMPRAKSPPTAALGASHRAAPVSCARAQLVTNQMVRTSLSVSFSSRCGTSPRMAMALPCLKRWVSPLITIVRVPSST